MILKLKRKLLSLKRKNRAGHSVLRDYFFRKQLEGIEISNEVLVRTY